MIPPRHGSPIATIPALAGSIAHEINNHTGLLFSALDHLEAGGSTSRARSIVEEACGAAQVLAAALMLITLGPDDINLLTAEDHVFRLEADDLDRLRERLFEITAVNVDLSPALGNTPINSLFDRSLLQATLLCMAARCKRQLAPDTGIRGVLYILPAVPGAKARCIIQFAEHKTSEKDETVVTDDLDADLVDEYFTAVRSNSETTIDRVLASALGHAAALLREAGVRLETPGMAVAVLSFPID
jgi:hypothetical protein